jgi:hypothetical protein
VSTSYNGFGIRDDSMNPRQEPARRFGIAKDNFIVRHVATAGQKWTHPPSENGPTQPEIAELK